MHILWTLECTSHLRVIASLHVLSRILIKTHSCIRWPLKPTLKPSFLCIEVSYDNNVVDSCPQPVASFSKVGSYCIQIAMPTHKSGVLSARECFFPPDKAICQMLNGARATPITNRLTWTHNWWWTHCLMQIRSTPSWLFILPILFARLS